MKFLERVKKILFERNKRQIESTSSKIEKLEKECQAEEVKISDLNTKINEINEEQKKLQSVLLSEEEQKDLKIINEFVSNYQAIGQAITQICEMDAKHAEASNEVVYQDLIKLNEKLSEIDKNRTSGKYEKKQLKFEDCQKMFSKYKMIIDNFPYLNSIGVIDKKSNEQMLNCIKLYKKLQALSKNKIDEIDESFINELKNAEPFELWTEIKKYYSNIQWVTTIMDNFESLIKQISNEQSQEFEELLNPQELEYAIEEQKKMFVYFKGNSKELKTKNKDLQRIKQTLGQMKEKLDGLKEQRKKLEEKNDEIANATGLEELKYKDKNDAAKKLGIKDIKDYVIMPIPNDVKKISELFTRKKKLKVEVDDKTFFTTYTNNTAHGYINSIGDESDLNAVLMIPINSIKKEQIDCVKKSKINLKETALKNKGIIAIVSSQRNIDFENLPIKLTSYSSGDMKQQLTTILREDYVDGFEDMDNYDLLKLAPSFSESEKRIKRDAVLDCLFENIQDNSISEKNIMADGELYHFSREDEKNLNYRDIKENIDEKKLNEIANDINKFLLEDDKKWEKIDKFYRELLLEYLRVEKKAKAEYYDEEKTTVTISRKKMSIKPILSPSKNEIIKRYARKGEDVAYKTMKLAKIVNKFAHISPNSELVNKLYDIKSSLIEEVIQFAKNNPEVNMNVKYQFDDEKKADSVVVKIPGYSMIALHIINRDGLISKAKKLDANKDEILSTSIIMAPGVNEEFLKSMKKMNVDERMKTLINLDSATLAKLAIRMGYDIEKISSRENRKEFIESMVSDKKIEELLKEQEELEI